MVFAQVVGSFLLLVQYLDEALSCGRCRLQEVREIRGLDDRVGELPCLWRMIGCPEVHGPFGHIDSPDHEIRTYPML
jgi:hypothetical protein